MASNMKNVLARTQSLALDQLTSTLGRIRREGATKLMVIADFDFTLSKFQDEQGKCWSTHGCFHRPGPLITPQLIEKLDALNHKYLPIEYDPDISIADKTPHMVTWWNESHAEIIRAGFTSEQVAELANRSRIFLRKGVVEWIKLLEKHSVPLIIFSAGIADIIIEVLRTAIGHQPPNVHIISNRMRFNDADGKLVGFSEPLIHTFCKNSTVIDRSEHAFFHSIANRSNVLLFGDSLGDLHMDVGVEHEQSVVKFGFLNQDVDRLLQTYLEGYHAVMVEQVDHFEVPLDVTRILLGEGDNDE